MEELSSQLSNDTIAPFTHFGCKYPQIKAESLHLKRILIVLFQVQCGGVQSQHDEICVNMDLTVCSYTFFACWVQVQSSQAKATIHARSSADKTFPLEDSQHSNMARQMVWHSASVNTTEKTREKHKRTWEIVMEREVEESQVRTGGSVRDIKEGFDVESERHHVDHVERLQAERKRHVADFPHSQQNDFCHAG